MANQMHIKGRLVQLLEERPAWDYELAERIAAEYPEAQGEYWSNTIRLNLADLHSGGLVYHEDDAVDPDKTYGVEKVLFKFALSDFGRERMQQTGLLQGSPTKRGR